MNALQTYLMTIRLGLNGTEAGTASMLREHWECQLGSSSASDRSALKLGGPIKSIKDIVMLCMIASVLLWFALRAALFNVVKNERLCGCCKKEGTDGRESSNRVQKVTRKWLKTLCPYALNVLMGLNSSFKLSEEEQAYAASLSIFTVITVYATLIMGVICILLALVFIVLALLAALGATGVQKLFRYNSKGASQWVYTALFWGAVFNLFFFSIVGSLYAPCYIESPPYSQCGRLSADSKTHPQNLAPAFLTWQVHALPLLPGPRHRRVSNS